MNSNSKGLKETKNNNSKYGMTKEELVESLSEESNQS